MHVKIHDQKAQSSAQQRKSLCSCILSLRAIGKMANVVPVGFSSGKELTSIYESLSEEAKLRIKNDTVINDS